MEAPESDQHTIHIEHDDRSLAGSESSYFTDADDDSCHSHFFYSTSGDYGLSYVSDGGAPAESRRPSSASECSIQVVEIEGGGIKIIGCHSKVERDCRICHLGLESNSEESGAPINLGCSCKDDLAAAHTHCAEAWFKIKGNKTCEICQSIARNVVGPSDIEMITQAIDASATAAVAETAPQPPETQSFWRGHRFLNFLLACMVFAFVISWLLHFNVTT